MWRPTGATLQRVGEQNSGSRDVEQLSAPFGQAGQQVDDVEIVEQAVNELDDGVQHLGFTRGISHDVLLSRLFEFA